MHLLGQLAGKRNEGKDRRGSPVGADAEALERRRACDNGPRMSEVELNAPQAQAVAHRSGPLLVFAGAGSGKTRVITYRIANLVAAEGVPAHRILAVTFTNKAAREMRERLEGLLGEDLARRLWVGTFHSLGAKLLRLHGSTIGLKSDFAIYDGTDQKALVARILKDLSLDDKRYPAKVLLGQIGHHKQKGLTPDDVHTDDSAHAEVFAEVWRHYEARMRAANALDFEDILLRSVDLLDKELELGVVGVRERFDHVLVDEFQDTNGTQYRWLKGLAQFHGNLCVVGDDDQSIYAWRGADVRNIQSFRRDHPGAEVVKLEQNYRSTAHIVEAALAVVSKAQVREPKKLWTENEAGDPIQIVELPDERAEAAFALRCIREGIEEGASPRDFAVFYRIHAQSRVLEEGLRTARIAYKVVGGMRFYERAEIKDAIAYLRLALNPSSDVDFLRVVNVPARGIGQTTVDRLAERARRLGKPLFEATADLASETALPAAGRKKLEAFRALLEGLRRSIGVDTPSAFVDRVLDETGYRKALEKEDSVEADGRLENLEELRSALLDFERECELRGEPPTMATWLENAALHSEADAVVGESVSLMTVHAAKGLEFPFVVLTGMEEELFPYRGLDPAERDELDEERRLAYVAITRARERLVCTHVKLRQLFGQTRVGIESRFLRELPKHTIARFRCDAYGRVRPLAEVERVKIPAAPPTLERRVDTSYFDDVSDDEAGLRPGAFVRHATFGSGRVRSLERRGSEIAAQVEFKGMGVKTIYARFLVADE
jgi:DNA helicase-2/ATP-dependent DNA helicase PcrA